MAGDIADNVTLLTSAARTTAYDSGALVNDGFKGITVVLDVTAASGTGGLTLSVNMIDPASGNAVALLTASAAVTATGTKAYSVYPSGGTTGAGITQLSNFTALSPYFSVKVAVGDSSSYTYTIGYCLLD